LSAFFATDVAAVGPALEAANRPTIRSTYLSAVITTVCAAHLGPDVSALATANFPADVTAFNAAVSATECTT